MPHPVLPGDRCRRLLMGRGAAREWLAASRAVYPMGLIHAKQRLKRLLRSVIAAPSSRHYGPIRLNARCPGVGHGVAAVPVCASCAGDEANHDRTKPADHGNCSGRHRRMQEKTCCRERPE